MILRSVRSCSRYLHTKVGNREGRSIKSILDNAASHTNQDTEVQGWIRSLRKGKNVSFLVVNDGSTHENIQAVLTPDQASNTGYLLISIRKTEISADQTVCHMGPA